MQKLVVFQTQSIDGYFVDRQGSMEWAKHDNDDEFMEFTKSNAQGGGTLVFGRVTYDLMRSFWPTPMAKQMMPEVAERMNGGQKLVFSRKLKKAQWENTTLHKGDPIAELKRRKSLKGSGLAILGSGSLVAQIAAHKLIDEYQIVVDPVALGGGRTMFEGLKKDLSFKLTGSRTFGNGKVFLRYKPRG